ncbi:MAG: dihydrodipicolinate synthase family protein [Marinovum algicola]|uniref:dihydrodipicolinate synthase family protein n=1 Tax=Roseobacteraceae TaxID=2854170 RepID=UPI0032ECFDBC
MSITPYLPDQIRQGKVFTWVNSQWKFWGIPGQFSAEINKLCSGSPDHGSTGIGTTYNLFRKLYQALWQAVQAGDLARMQELQTISQEFVEILVQTGVLPCMKTALKMIGVDCGPVRAPLAPRSDKAEALLRPLLDRDDVAYWIAR